MKKIWYIDIRGQLEGPYSLGDLRRDKRVNPDTLVWREGFAHSVPIRNVPELKNVFTDEEPAKEKKEKKHPLNGKQQSDLILLEMSQEPPFFIWAIIVLTLFMLAWYLHRQ